jgi:hypothetical protein
MSSTHNIRAETVQIKRNNIQIAEVPVDANGSWTYGPTPELPPGQHVFTAHAGDKQSAPWTVQVVEEEMNLTRAHFRNATPAPGDPDRELIDYYAQQGDGYVEIPLYGMKVGDEVEGSFSGRVHTQHDVFTVTNESTQVVFKISMYNIIDAIHFNATITYTVKRNGVTHTSTSRILTITGYSGYIEAPTINSPTNNNIRVQFEVGYYTAQVRFIGKPGDTVESAVRKFDGNDINFTIDPAWAARNRGLPVLFNYSLKRFDDDRIYYSQILRIDNLRSEPAGSEIEQIDPQTRDAIYNFIVSAYKLVKQLFKR